MNAAESKAPWTRPGMGGGSEQQEDTASNAPPSMGERLAAILGADLTGAAGGVGVPFLKMLLVSALHRTWASDAGVVRDRDSHLALEHGIGVASVRRAREALTRLGVVRVVSRHPGGIVYWAVDHGRLLALARAKPEPTALPQSAVEAGSAIPESAVGVGGALSQSAGALSGSGGALSQSANPGNEHGNEPPPPPAPVHAQRSGVGVGAALGLVRYERPPAPLRLAASADVTPPRLAAAPAVGEGLAELERVGVSPSVARDLAAKHRADEIRAVVASVAGAKGVQDRAAVVVAALRRGDGPDLLRRQRDARATRASVTASGATGGNGPSLAERGASERANLEASRAADETAAWIADPRNAAAVAELVAEYRSQPLRPGVGLTDARVAGSGFFRAWAAPRIAALEGVAA